MPKERILIIEDEDDIRETIRFSLEKEGWNDIIEAGTGEDGLDSAMKFSPDLILLDLMLPGMDGLTVCRKLKAQDETKNIPVIMLTAKSDESDIVVGLEVGADDYITKPFSNKVLCARIRSVMRRSQSTSEDDEANIVKRGDLVMDKDRRIASIGGKDLDLTYSEFELLFMMARKFGRVFTRNRIVNELRGDDYPVTERAIDVQIVGLRKKLGDYGKLIETVRGVGYRFRD
jgi:two-component system phosphate regulon response regulator PhoB